jgi:hypothetical protein
VTRAGVHPSALAVLSRVRQWIAGWLLLAALPAYAVPELGSMHLHGSATLRFLGMKVYDIRLWRSTGEFTRAAPHALELVYAMNFSARDIAARSVEEMRKLGVEDPVRLTRWEQALAQMLPDVRKGERLVGVAVPGRGVQFYHGSRWLGSIDEPDFVAAFFDIWLSDATSAPALRRQLLGVP